MRLRKKNEKLLGLIPLIGLVVGSMLGSGVFNMIREAASAQSLMGVIIGWAIVGFGMLMLTLCFVNLNRKRPDLDAGVYSYAQAGFGKYMGFNSAWGYWISAWIGNVSYATMMFTAFGFFFPNIFGSDGQNLASVVGASVMLWLVTWLMARGVKSASFVNTVVTAAKIIPIVVFIVALALAFKLNIFTADIWGTTSGHFELGSLFDNVKSMMLATVFVVIGVEGAVVYSGLARNRRDVGRATILGFLTVLAIYILMTVLSLGVMTAPELAATDGVAMSAVLQSVVGDWGAVLVNIGVIVALIGAWLAWTMFCSEVPYEAAKSKVFPKSFARVSRRGVPIVALLWTSILTQIFILTFLLPFGSSAYHVGVSLTSSMILIPYALVAFFQIKNTWVERSGTKGRVRNLIIGFLAALYTVWLLYAGGLDYLLISMLLYAPGIIAFIILRRENHAKRIFTKPEWVVMLAILALFILAVVQIITGQLDVANM
jgi:arginine:ornithine antiporter/lysine permease